MLCMVAAGHAEGVGCIIPADSLEMYLALDAAAAGLQHCSRAAGCASTGSGEPAREHASESDSEGGISLQVPIAAEQIV